MSIKSNLARLRERIGRAADRAGRNPDEIRIVVVTKTVGVGEIRQAIDCGVHIIGENRVREALAKQPEIGRSIEWHMVGHLQSRKAKQAVGLFDMIHSVDSISTAAALQKRCAESGHRMPVLIEINTSEEAQKHGVRPDEAESLLRQIAALEDLRVEGLMTMAPLVHDPEEARPCFRMLRRLAEGFRGKNIEGASFDVLSMGMTNDFEVAVEEGSTMLRIGTAVFRG